jgi:asparagine synthase (glutamine-hydrolysing)
MLEKNMYLDFKTWFQGDILPKVDRTSMYHSQEIRLPFLDTELVTFIIKLPLQMKINFFNRKFLLKKILSNNFNKDFINRKKSGFNFPIGFFLINNKKFKELSYYLLKTRKMNNIFKSDFIEKLWLDHQKEISDNSYKIFNLICLSQWINKNNIST